MSYRKLTHLVLIAVFVVLLCNDASAWQRTILPLILFDDSKSIDGFYFELDIDYALKDVPIHKVDCEKSVIACAVIPVINSVIDDDLSTYTELVETQVAPEAKDKIADSFKRFHGYLGPKPCISIDSISRIGSWYKVRFLSRAEDGSTKQLTLAVKRDSDSGYSYANDLDPRGPQGFLWAGILNGLDRSWSQRIIEVDERMIALPISYYQESDPEACATLYVVAEKLSGDNGKQVKSDFSIFLRSMTEILNTESASGLTEETSFDGMSKDLRGFIEARFKNGKKLIEGRSLLRQEFAFLMRATSPVLLLGEGNEIYCVVEALSTSGNPEYRLLPVERTDEGFVFGGGAFDTGGRGDGVTAIFNEKDGDLLRLLMGKISSKP